VLGEALWGVYDLRELWRSIGPRINTERVAPTPRRHEALLLWQPEEIQEVSVGPVD
jgi:hypothetical protein